MVIHENAVNRRTSTASDQRRLNRAGGTRYRSIHDSIRSANRLTGFPGVFHGPCDGPVRPFVRGELPGMPIDPLSRMR